MSGLTTTFEGYDKRDAKSFTSGAYKQAPIRHTQAMATVQAVALLVVGAALAVALVLAVVSGLASGTIAHESGVVAVASVAAVLVVMASVAAASRTLLASRRA